MDYSTFLRLRDELNFRMPDASRVWRWEYDLFTFCRTSPSLFPLIGTLVPDAHWTTVAQDRELWQSLEGEFVHYHTVNPRSKQIALEDWYLGEELFGRPHIPEEVYDLPLPYHRPWP